MMAQRLLRHLGVLAAAPMLLAMADPPPFGATVQPVPPPVLDTIRGGFLLPNGIDLAMTVQTETAVDGHLVLRSIFRADQGPATLTVYAPAAGTTGPAMAGGSQSGGSSTGTPAGVAVTIDRGSGIVSVQPSTGTLPGGASVSVGGTSSVASQGGTSGLVTVPAGGSVAAGAGTVTVRNTPIGPTAEYAAPDLQIDHLFGRAFGSLVANTGNDRSIDTVTSVDLDLHNAGPALVGSSMLQAQALALDAARGLAK